MYPCGILYAADFEIVLLKLGTIYYSLYRENNWRFETITNVIMLPQVVRERTLISNFVKEKSMNAPTN